jgi:hypothetical protein
MARDVLQGFLGDPKEAQRDGRIDRVRLEVGIHHHLAAVQLRKLFAVAPKDGGNSRMLQRGGMQIVREVPDAFGEIDRPRLQGATSSRKPAVAWTSGCRLRAADGNCERGDPLSDVVVQLPRDPRALHFLRGDQLSLPGRAPGRFAP